MREFKFLRGIYNDERIFNTDETNGTLFALYGDGKLASLDAKNDEDFQKTIANLKPDTREIYTVRPSQFVVSAEKKNDENYTITYELNKRVYDNSKEFPDDVKKAAKNYLSENTTAVIPDKPSLILSGANETPTSVEFIYDNKSFKKNLYFGVSGSVEEYAIQEAENKDITAYKMNGDEVDFYDKVDNGTFYGGKLQEEIPSYERYIAQEYVSVNDKNYEELDIASKYRSEQDYMFVCDNTLTSDASYSDTLNFDLYKYIEDATYLTSASREDAVSADNKISIGYVAYELGCCPEACYKKQGTQTLIFEYLKDGLLNEDTQIPQNANYAFYKINHEPAYIKVGKCVAKERTNTIVKGYENSFSGLFIIKNNKLEHIIDNDLSYNSTKDVYLQKEDSYKVIYGGVYKDANTTDKYVTLSNKEFKSIDISNAYINKEGKIAPQQDKETFRQIVESTLRIEATESYSY